MGISTHVGQNLVEFHEMLRRHGKTPVELLDETGLLGPDTILGHCLMTTSHRLAALPGGRDLEILALRQATVAHCPLVFARRGNALESFHRYRAAGVNVGLGTDTYPRDLISEMRWASLLCKVVEHDFTVATAADVFNAATLAGARALRRDDIGRLAPGAKADILLINLDQLGAPVYADPIKALVDGASGRDVDTVIVDGKVLVQGGRATRVNEDEIYAKARRATEQYWSHVSGWRWDGATVERISPPAFPMHRAR